MLPPAGAPCCARARGRAAGQHASVQSGSIAFCHSYDPPLCSAWPARPAACECFCCSAREQAAPVISAPLAGDPVRQQRQQRSGRGRACTPALFWRWLFWPPPGKPEAMRRLSQQRVIFILAFGGRAYRQDVCQCARKSRGLARPGRWGLGFFSRVQGDMRTPDCANTRMADTRLLFTLTWESMRESMWHPSRAARLSLSAPALSAPEGVLEPAAGGRRRSRRHTPAAPRHPAGGTPGPARGTERPHRTKAGPPSVQPGHVWGAAGRGRGARLVAVRGRAGAAGGRGRGRGRGG